MSKTRLKANFLASLSNKGVSALEHLVLVPIFLYQWGAEYYGSWLVLTAIPSFLAMSDLGLGTAASTRIILALGKDKEAEANATLAFSSLFIGVVFSLIVLGLALAPSSIFTFAPEFPIQPPLTILAILIASIGINVFVQPLQGYWIARKKAATSTFLLTGLMLARFSTTSFLVFSGHMALDVAIGILASTAIWAVLYTLVTTPYIRWQYSFKFSLSMSKPLIGKGLGFQSNALWQALLFQGSIWLANYMMGPVAAATWGTLRTLSRAGNQLLSLVSQTIMPELQISVAKSDWEYARRLHSAALLLASFIGIVTALGLSIAGSWAYSWWTRGEFDVGFWVWPVLAVGLLLNVLWWTSAIVHRAVNQPWRINLLGIASSIIALIVMAVGAELTSSILSFVFGSLVFDAIMASYVMRRSLFLLNDDFKTFILRCYVMIEMKAKKLLLIE